MGWALPLQPACGWDGWDPFFFQICSGREGRGLAVSSLTSPSLESFEEPVVLHPLERRLVCPAPLRGI